MGFTDDMKKELLLKRKEIMGRHLALEADKERKGEPLDKDFEEQATQLENQEVIDALDDHALIELKQIDVALNRIDAGTYGQCAECGDNIGQARLKALPFASVCIKCAETED